MKKASVIILLVVLNIFAVFGVVFYTVYKTANKPAIETINVAMVVGDSGFMFETEKYSKVTIASETENIIEYNGKNSIVPIKPGTLQLVVSMPKSNIVKQYNVVVYPVGDGTVENPYNITKPEHILRQDKNYGSGKVFSLRSDLDLSGIESWKPIGTRTNPFRGEFLGNGYNVINMTISLNQNNKADYIDDNEGVLSIRLGFFGFVEGESDSKLAVISNLGIKNAIINTNQLNNYLISQSVVLNRVLIGAMVGQARLANFYADGMEVQSKINSSLTNSDDTYNSMLGAAGGFAGGLYFGEIKGYSARVELLSDMPSFYLGSDMQKVNPFGSRMAGLVGTLYSSKLTNCSATGSMSASNYRNSYMAGLVVYSESESVIKDCKVSDMVFVGNNVDDNYLTTNTALKIAGAVSLVEKYQDNKSLIENVEVSRVWVQAAEVGQFSGIATTNQGVIKNSSFSGEINAYIASGFVHENVGDILFDNNFHGVAVNAKIYTRTIGAGFVINHLDGNIIGSESNRTKVVSNIYLNVSHLRYTNDLDSKYYSVGFGGEIYSNISNFEVETKISKGYNIGGLFGKIVGNNEIIINNVSVIASIITSEGQKGEVEIESEQNKISVDGMTNSVAGIACKIESNVKLEDIEVIIIINKNIDKEKKFGLNYFGGIFVEADGNSVANFENVEIYLELFSNYSNKGSLTDAKYDAGIAINNSNIQTTGVTASGKITRDTVEYEVA